MPKDPYRYFRVEALELLEGLGQGVLQLEQGTTGPEVIARLLRLAHTLKGAARVVRQPHIAELAHAFEGLLTPHRDGATPLAPELPSALLRLLDEATGRLSSIEPARERSGAAPPRPSDEAPLESLRVDLSELDALLRTVAEAAVQLGAVRRELALAAGCFEVATRLLEPGALAAEAMRAGLEHLQGALAGELGNVDATLTELGDAAQRVRLVPAKTLFPSLERSVRDAAQSLGKRVEFETEGGEVRVAAGVLATLGAALMHLVRNAVAHGLEPEAERVALGKPAVGRVRLVVEQHGGQLLFQCGDDGRGIDVEAVRAAAVARGRVSAAEGAALPQAEVLALLGSGGLSTASDVTELSGRGIGLDVVRAATARLKGELRLGSEPGRGATVEIRVPLSLASLHALVVEAGGVRAALPLSAVRHTLRVTDAELVRAPEGDCLLHRGRVLPFARLDRLLRCAAPVQPGRGEVAAVIVETGTRRVAIAVDALLGTATVVMRAFPEGVEADPVVGGVSLDAEGNPQLVLDPAGLVTAAEAHKGAAPSAPTPPRAPVLVIDDSLTTRMMEQSILESAGYAVEVALSAEEGLAKAHLRPYSLFIVDVEMPGLDGFEFVTLTRADPVLRQIPAILVTSRNADGDRQRGLKAGAHAYVVKGEFDQAKLLQTIGTLLGAP